MITLLPTPIGNLGDISLRALEVLAQSEVILCEDTRVTKRLLHLLSKNPIIFKNFPSIFQEKVFYSFHSHNQEAFLSQKDRSFFEQAVVFVSDAGMPCISDPGALLVQYAQRHNIIYDILPGSNASLLAYCMSGFDADSFIFGGFLPHKQQERKKAFSNFFASHSKIAKQSAIIFYESPHRILDSLQDLVSIDEECHTFAIKEMSKKNQKFFKGSAKEVLHLLLQSNIQGEWVLVLSPSKKQEQVLSLQEVEQMDLPPKIKAKILAKITKQTPKSIYNTFLSRLEQ